MNDDQLFRLILLAGFVILLPIGIYHRLESRTGEKLDRRQEGLFILVALRLCGITGLLTRIFHTAFLRMGGTGYQPVLVGNLPARRGQAPCRDEEMRSEKFDAALPPGW